MNEICIKCEHVFIHIFMQFFMSFYVFFFCFCCLTSQVNNYGHGRTVSSPNHTFFLGKLKQAFKDIENLAIILVPLIMILSRGHTGQIKG